MRSLSSSDCLHLWERGLGLHTLDRGLLALGAALPRTSYESLADWPLGRLNSALAELRCACFGRDLRGWISCPQCTEKLEFQMDTRALVTKEPCATAAIVVKGLSFRLPTGRDLAFAARETDPRLAATIILERCRVEADEAAGWLDEDLEEVGEKMALADPMAESRLTFECPECRHQWDESLDINAFLWTEIEARAKRLLTEVHTLAARYGWREDDILALSEPRRALYLEMARA